jgi:hypothetical protein
VAALFPASATAAEVPPHGGILSFVVASEPPSYDGQRETTFGTIHPIAPFYSTLIRMNPENPSSTIDKLFDNMNRATDLARQRRLMRQCEKRILNEQGHMLVALWLYRIIPYRSVVKGWKISPSHHLNRDLSTVWLAH